MMIYIKVIIASDNLIVASEQKKVIEQICNQEATIFAEVSIVSKKLPNVFKYLLNQDISPFIVFLHEQFGDIPFFEQVEILKDHFKNLNIVAMPHTLTQEIRDRLTELGVTEILPMWNSKEELIDFLKNHIQYI